MARIRTIKPEFWQDEKLLPLTDTTRLVFLGLISLADDCGRLVYNPKLIEALLFDPDGPDRSRDVREALANLSRIGRIVIGKAQSGQRVLQIVHWDKHQKVDKPNRAAALPEIVEPLEDTSIRESVANDSRMIREAFANDSRPIPTTNDQRPTTDDQVAAGRKRPAPQEKAYPHFGQETRARCLAAFRRLGAFEPGRVIKAVAPFFRAPDDPEFVPHDKVAFAIEDYVGVVSKGRSAPFAGPEDCAKRLGVMARNCLAFEWDPLGRFDAQMLAVHGTSKLVA